MSDDLSVGTPLPGITTLGTPESGPTASGATRNGAVTYSCGGCDNRWPGVSRCHCTGCHRTFGGLGLFDAHRRDVKGKGTCLDPAELGMFLAAGIWSSSETPRGNAEALAAHREARA